MAAMPIRTQSVQPNSLFRVALLGPADVQASATAPASIRIKHAWGARDRNCSRRTSWPASSRRTDSRASASWGTPLMGNDRAKREEAETVPVECRSVRAMQRLREFLLLHSALGAHP